MILQLPVWVYIAMKQKQDLKELSTLPNSLQHYLLSLRKLGSQAVSFGLITIPQKIVLFILLVIP